MEKVASLNCVVMAMPTVILVSEYFIVRKLLNIPMDLHIIESDEYLPTMRVPALAALAFGSLVGIATAGIIPALEPLHVGLCSFQGWLAGLALYVPIRWIEHRRAMSDERLLADARVLQPQLAVQRVSDD